MQTDVLYYQYVRYNKNMKLGTTFSHRHAKAIGLSIEESFEALLALRFPLIRLCCYWDELQPTKNTYDFPSIKVLLDACEKIHQNVILTVGMKAPRWPEFYIPSWLPQRPDNPAVHAALLPFLQKTIQTLQPYTCITTWQVENEPLDPSGPKHLSIPLPVLSQEVSTVRSLDERPIVLTLWGNDAVRRGCIPEASSLADVVGIDLYFRVPTKRLLWHTYAGPSDNPHTTCRTVQRTKKPLWITELQAEAWEPHTSFSTHPDPPSMNARILEEHYKKALKLNPDVLLLWGYEYWYWKAHHGDASLWNEVKLLLQEQTS